MLDQYNLAKNVLDQFFSQVSRVVLVKIATVSLLQL